MRPKKTKSQYKIIVGQTDAVFSRFIRLEAASKDGYAQCVTCRKIRHWKEMQAGHYVKRSKMGTRYDTTNVHPQCAQCNILKKGNYTVYAIYMKDRYGQKHLDWLEWKGKQPLTKFEMWNLASVYKQKVKELLNERK